MNYNSEEIANKLTILMFSGFSVEDIAEISKTSIHDVELAMNQQTNISDRAQRFLIPTIEKLYNQVSQLN